MPSTTGYSFGDVVLVPFPFTDQTTSKKRPAVVISSEAYNRHRPDVILTAITSRLVRAAGDPGECLIEAWHEAGLPKPSLIKPVVATVHADLILKRLGSLQPADVVSLRHALGTLFA